MEDITKDFPTGWKRNSQADLAFISETDIECRICKNNVRFMESSQSPSGGEYFICSDCASKIEGRY